MLKVIAEKYIKADRVGEFIELANQLVKATNENDGGCMQYELLQDIKDSQHFTILEAWEDEEALTRHSKAAHFTSIVPLFADLSEKPGEVHLFHKLA